MCGGFKGYYEKNHLKESKHTSARQARFSGASTVSGGLIAGCKETDEPTHEKKVVGEP